MVMQPLPQVPDVGDRERAFLPGLATTQGVLLVASNPSASAGSLAGAANRRASRPRLRARQKFRRDDEGATRTASRGRKTASWRGPAIADRACASSSRHHPRCDRSKLASRRPASTWDRRHHAGMTRPARRGRESRRGGNFGRDQCFDRRHRRCQRRRDLDRAGAGRR